MSLVTHLEEVLQIAFSCLLLDEQRQFLLRARKREAIFFCLVCLLFVLRIIRRQKLDVQYSADVRGFDVSFQSWDTILLKIALLYCSNEYENFSTRSACSKNNTSVLYILLPILSPQQLCQ